jgi:hypothetical protein
MASADVKILGGKRNRSPQTLMAVRNEVKDMLRANVGSIESRFSCLKPNPGRALSAAKIAQAAVGRRSSKTASQQRRGRRVSNRKPFSFSSVAFADVRIGYRHQKEAQPEGQHDDIQHGVLLVALVSGRDGCAFRERRLRWIKNSKRRCIYVFEMGVTATL